MDFPVKATILVDHFLDAAAVHRLLRSHGFKVVGQGGGQVHVQGYFKDLEALKARLEQLVTGNNPDEGGSASPSSSSSPQDYRAASPPDRQASGGETIVVDTDVFRYAKLLRNNELRTLLTRCGAEVTASGDGESTSISFQGRGSRMEVRKLQTLLEDLNRSLRTQEVPLRDLDPQGRVLLKKIQKNQNVSDSVVVFELQDRVHLIGPSKDSYELKQRLLGSPIDQSGPRGRSGTKSSRARSSSAPPAHPESSGRAGGSAGPPAGGAAASGPAAPRRPSLSESRELRRTEKLDQNQNQERNLSSLPKLKNKLFNINLKNVKPRFKK
ncbi:uncharacterized protein LOC112451406 [Kryptolebias marmoratus]|uniref:uncharacterized protein LOC112451406 n=1 Tax=Kryptolebias marmoratus TaxID=37003 RepID=UPI000D53034A|nr:uncharacterized protein LOC112451406 [Kryptolebias marmoratus]